MSARRFITLYYASITSRRALQAILYWLRGAVVSRARRRAAFTRTVTTDTGARAAFALGSARSALTLCLRGAGIGKGDEVVVSSYTCLAVASGVVAAGATPVYVDINPDTLNVDVDIVRAAVSPRTRAIIVQHTLGKPAPVAAIVEFARERDVLVIEDCALAIGSQLNGRAVGSFGDAAIFSLELSKTLSCGWGGVLTANDPQLAAGVQQVYEAVPERGYWAATRDLWQTAISAWSHRPEIYDRIGKYVLFAGFTSKLFRRSTPPEEYEGGFSSDFLQKMAGAQADLARLQWRDLTAITARCAQLAQSMRAALEDLGIESPGRPAAGELSVAPRVSFLADDRAEIITYFRERGIELGEWFDGPMSPVPTAPQFNYSPGSYPQAEAVARRITNLPCHSRLTDSDVDNIVETLKAYYGSRFAFSN